MIAASLVTAGEPTRNAGARRDSQIVARLRKASGQLSGVAGMVKEQRCSIDILDQLAAVTAALDAVALLVLADHINACVHASLETGETEAKAAELIAFVRRYMRSR